MVWFGEELPRAPLLAAEKAADNCSLFLSIGTSSVVYPASGMIDLALRNNARFLEINPAPTPYTRKASWTLQAPSGQALPELVAAL